VVGSVEGIDADAFAAAAEDAKTNCPVSQALTGTTITLDASLA
jgi:osmotically inducible protein OsmC